MRGCGFGSLKGTHEMDVDPILVLEKTQRTSGVRGHAMDAVVRRADLIQLEQIASGYPSRERFLTELTLDPPDATSDQAGVPLLDEDYLILSTIHSAKGQE
jgi:superfamily I DNA/RNA helicase